MTLTDQLWLALGHETTTLEHPHKLSPHLRPHQVPTPYFSFTIFLPYISLYSTNLYLHFKYHSSGILLCSESDPVLTAYVTSCHHPCIFIIASLTSPFSLILL